MTWLKKNRRDPSEGGPIWNAFYKFMAGPANGVDNAIEGDTKKARDAWHNDLEMRKQWSRDQRERKRAAHGVGS
ncbi:hypothetical protein KRMM14A1259_28510 [Krasilnikovia sp. MM14-A1259]